MYSRAKTPSNPLKNSGNKTSNEKNEIPIIDLLKCPICKNVCLMTINRDKLLFSFECNNNHKNNNLKKSKTYFNNGNKIFNSNISDLNISHDKEIKMTNKDNNTSNYTNNSKKNNNLGHNIYITEKDFSCQKHHNLKFQSYCYDCKENICNECYKEHIDHSQIKLDTIKPKDSEVIICKNNIKKKDEELNNIIEYMVKWRKEFEYGLSTIIKIMQNISNLRQFIIMNYDSKQSNQNYNYLQNFNNMKVLDFIFPELQEFMKEKNWKKRGHILIEIIINIQHKIIENKEKLKIMKLKEEIDKKTELLKQKQEKNEKNILKSKNKGINNQDTNEDIGSVETGNSNYKKVKNFNTTFSSDCMNNNYFCRDVSRKVRNTKKKVIAKRNKDKNDNSLSHTIEQNKELEKNLNDENNIKNEENNDIDMDQSIHLDPKLIKVVETKNKNIVNNNNNTSENNNNNQNMNNTFSYMDANNSNKDANNSNKNNDNTVEIKNNTDNIENNENYENKDENNNKMGSNIEENNNVKKNTEENDNNIMDKKEDDIKDDDNDNKIVDNKNISEENKDNKENENNENNNIEEKEQFEEKKEVVENIKGANESINDMEIKNDDYNISTLKNKNINKNNDKNRQKKIYKDIELKYELINTDIIRSIEFINNNHILICTLENITIYKINPNYELVKEYDIKEFNYRINYATQISNGNLIICSLNNIDIIQLSEVQPSEGQDQSISYNIIQKLTGKNNSYNINKVIEIKGKEYLISCDKNNLIIFSKNKETNLYQELKYIATNSEVKCLEEINEDIFVTVEPEEQCVIFYKIDNLENTYTINNIQSSFGRYIISYVEKYNCIFVTGSQGVYLISTEKYELITFFQVKEWISSIHYDYYNDYLICGTWKKNTINGQKIYNLILYEVVEDNVDTEKKTLDNMIIREVERKNNIHLHDIVVIKPSEEGFILTGSNDRTVKIWN